MYSSFQFYNSGTATVTVTSDNIRGGVTYEHNINPDTDLTVGSTSSAKISFVIDNTSFNTPITIPSIGNNFTWTLTQSETAATQKGRFVVDKVEKEANDRYKITGYDYISKFDVDVRE